MSHDSEKVTTAKKELALTNSLLLGLPISDAQINARVWEWKVHPRMSRQCFRFLCQVDVRDKWHFTPLHSAANGGHVSTIQKLIQFSHDVDVKDYLGRHTPSIMDIAIEAYA